MRFAACIWPRDLVFPPEISLLIHLGNFTKKSDTRRCHLLDGCLNGRRVHRIGVDQGTLARGERGEREPIGTFAARALRFVTNATRRWSSRGLYSLRPPLSWSVEPD